MLVPLQGIEQKRACLSYHTWLVSSKLPFVVKRLFGIFWKAAVIRIWRFWAEKSFAFLLFFFLDTFAFNWLPFVFLSRNVILLSTLSSSLNELVSKMVFSCIREKHINLTNDSFGKQMLFSNIEPLLWAICLTIDMFWLNFLRINSAFKTWGLR